MKEIAWQTDYAIIRIHMYLILGSSGALKHQEKMQLL